MELIQINLKVKQEISPFSRRNLTLIIIVVPKDRKKLYNCIIKAVNVCMFFYTSGKYE